MTAGDDDVSMTAQQHNQSSTSAKTQNPHSRSPANEGRHQTKMKGNFTGLNLNNNRLAWLLRQKEVS